MYATEGIQKTTVLRSSFFEKFINLFIYSVKYFLHFQILYEKKKFLSMYLLKSQIIYHWNLICIMYHPNTTNTYNRLIITFNLKEIQSNSLYNEIEDSFKNFYIQEFDKEIFL